MSADELPPSLEWTKSIPDGLFPPTQFEIEKVKIDECPCCGGQLDTGWECNSCRYDAYWIAQAIYGLNPLISAEGREP